MPSPHLALRGPRAVAPVIQDRPPGHEESGNGYEARPPAEAVHQPHHTDREDEPADPAGKWSVRVVLKDDVRKVSIPLSMEFVVVDDRTRV